MANRIGSSPLSSLEIYVDLAGFDDLLGKIANNDPSLPSNFEVLFFW